jgi:hypothetical protein
MIVVVKGWIDVEKLSLVYTPRNFTRPAASLNMHCHRKARWFSELVAHIATKAEQNLLVGAINQSLYFTTSNMRSVEIEQLPIPAMPSVGLPCTRGKQVQGVLPWRKGNKRPFVPEVFVPGVGVTAVNLPHDFSSVVL